MAVSDEHGMFWNSQNGDRLYDANSLGKWLAKFFTTGVFAEDFQVTPGTGMEVVMLPGYVNIINPLSSIAGGKVKLFENETSLSLAMAPSTNPRIDTVVIERNDNERDITAKIITGTPSTTPVATPPVRTSVVYQLVIAEIYVNTGATSITADNITRKCADDLVCGIIKGTVTNNQLIYGSEDLIPGVSDLADGAFYFVYE